MSQPLTIDDIAKLLQTTQKKPRKKIERTEEQTSKMKERLAMMREKSLQARQAKALNKPPEVVRTETPSLEVKKLNEQDTEQLFEKKYNSRFEKIDETMGEIKSHLSDIKELKKQKALEKAKAKEEMPRKEVINEVVHQVQVNKPIAVSNPNKVPKTIDYRNMFIRR